MDEKKGMSSQKDQVEDDDFYCQKKRECLLEEEALSDAEEGFMFGYEEGIKRNFEADEEDDWDFGG